MTLQDRPTADSKLPRTAARAVDAGREREGSAPAQLRSGTAPRSLPGWFGAQLSSHPAVTWLRHPLVMRATLVWVGSRLAFGLVTYLAAVAQASSGPPPHSVSAHGALLLWDRWDVNWYLNIARAGYWQPSPATSALDNGGQSPTAFFPLYPLLIRLGTLLLGTQHALFAGMLISNVATLGAFIVVAFLAAHEAGPERAVPPMLLLAVYPLAFFTAAAYTEGLFLLLASGVLLSIRRSQWRWACACAVLAGLTRPTAMILVLPMAWEYISQHGWRVRGWHNVRSAGEIAGFGAVLTAVPLGMGAYAAFLAMRFGDPLSFLSAQLDWHRVGVPVWQALRIAAHNYLATPIWSPAEVRLLADLVPLGAFTLLTLASIRRMPVAYTLYMMGLLYLCVASPKLDDLDTFAAAGRYLIPAIPIFLLVGQWTGRRPVLVAMLTGVSVLLQLGLTWFWLTGGQLI